MLLTALALPQLAAAQEGATPPHWIWHREAAGDGGNAAETRYFRKPFAVKEPSRLVVEVTADDSYMLYLDGNPVAEGADWHLTHRHETKLAIGAHVLAARASNQAPSPAGLLVRGGILPLGQNVPIHSNSSWRTSATVPPGDGWTKVVFDDSNWQRAQDLGPLGSGPWGHIASGSDPAGRFHVPEGFKIDMPAAPEVTGSVVAFTFDQNGAPCVSTEQGPISRLIDDDHDGRFDRRQVIETQVRNCQGLAFIRGRLFAVGNGPQGAGIYRLSDADNDGAFEKCELVQAAVGGMGEHGPHAITLGPDGAIYYNNGNHAHLKSSIDPASPVNVAYEGELLPHYDDARGHAAGIMAPGGEILRSDDDGKTWKRVVAGFRNEYDFAFNADGELFTFDSDMEWDVGLPWYRPVRVNHCPVGAEFGWRNGSGKWPTYYFDSLPAVHDVGRGSPTGVTFYQGNQFPAGYRDSFLVCDWSQGRILAVFLKRAGASYSAESTELVTGQPLNCTDIEVGPEGSVYFTTGGRGTQGGLYRVTWAGGANHSGGTGAAQATNAARSGGSDGLEVLRAPMIPSPLASFTQHRLETIRRARPEVWGKLLETQVRRQADSALRLRALDLLCQFGPRPDDELLVSLADDGEATVRSRAIAILGQRTSKPAQEALEKALKDSDPFVRRHACEGLMQQPRAAIPIGKLIPLLSDPDRAIRFSARVAIEHGDVEKHRAAIVAITEPRPLAEGLLALARGTKLDGQRQGELLDRAIGMLTSNIAPELKCDVLRLIELVYLRGPKKADAPGSAKLRPMLLTLFSTSTDSPINREAARLLAYLDEPAAVAVIVQHQASVGDLKAQIHDAYCLRAMKNGWTKETKEQLWSWYQKSSGWEGGYSFQGYLDMMIQELVGLLDAQEKEQYLARAERFPFPTRVLVRGLDLEANPGSVGAMASLYVKLGAENRSGAVTDLRALIVEKLGNSPRADAQAALRELYSKNPAERDSIARALASHPTEESFPILVAALDSRDSNTTGLVLRGLGRLKSMPKGPEALAGLIRLARRSGPSMTGALNRLASRWTGAKAPTDLNNFERTIAAWEAVYHKQFPSGPAIAALQASGENSYSLPQLVENVLQSKIMKSASAERGRALIERAKCLDCHKFGTVGQGLGPDLTTVRSRFRPIEILESIVEPSKVISDQYKATTVATADGKVYNGMPVVSDGPALILLLSDGTKVTIAKDEIDDRKESKVSVMPENLINSLTFQEIADLLALFESAPRVDPASEAKK